LWKGDRTDFDRLLSAADWLQKVRAAGAIKLVGRALSLAEHGDIGERFAEKLSTELSVVGDELMTVAASLDLDWTAAFGKSAEHAALADVVERVRGWVDAKDRYMEWADLAETDAELRAAGASDMANRLSAGRLAPELAISELRHARAEAVWKAAIQQAPEIARPHGEERSALVAEFKRLDVERRRAVAGLIRARHSSAMPRGAMGEMAIVRGEVARKRGHLAIRKLIQRAGRTVQAIKPVFMMSPISVAQYLAPGSMAFDLVVIDEASQVRPEMRWASLPVPSRWLWLKIASSCRLPASFLGCWPTTAAMTRMLTRSPQSRFQVRHERPNSRAF
jgi:hypothetical protein